MTEDEIRLLKRLRNDIEPILRDGEKTIGEIMERLSRIDRFYRDEISVSRLHVSIQMMATLYDRDFCRTHRSSTRLALVDHPAPPMPIRPVTARTGHTRASRVAEAVEDREETGYGDFSASGKLTKAMYELKRAAEKWSPSQREDAAAADRPTITEN